MLPKNLEQMLDMDRIQRPISILALLSCVCPRPYILSSCKSLHNRGQLELITAFIDASTTGDLDAVDFHIILGHNILQRIPRALCGIGRQTHEDFSLRKAIALVPAVFVKCFLELLEAEAKENPVVRKVDEVGRRVAFKNASPVASRRTSAIEFECRIMAVPKTRLTVRYYLRNDEHHGPVPYDNETEIALPVDIRDRIPLLSIELKCRDKNGVVGDEGFVVVTIAQLRPVVRRIGGVGSGLNDYIQSFRAL
jgi:hypothetical protein